MSIRHRYFLLGFLLGVAVMLGVNDYRAKQAQLDALEHQLVLIEQFLSAH